MRGQPRNVLVLYACAWLAILVRLGIRFKHCLLDFSRECRGAFLQLRLFLLSQLLRFSFYRRRLVALRALLVCVALRVNMWIVHKYARKHLGKLAKAILARGVFCRRRRSSRRRCYACGTDGLLALECGRLRRRGYHLCHCRGDIRAARMGTRRRSLLL